MNQVVVDLLKETFPDSIIEVKEFRNETTIIVKKENIVKISEFLRDNPKCQFNYLSDLCGADAYTPENRFEVIYNLLSIPLKHRIRIKIFTDETNPNVPTVSNVWEAANWCEREAYDMYGIIFDGHNDLRRMFMPEDFEYFPLRKNFPLMGIPNSLPLPETNPIK
ncbi:MAG: NADH-quinone oxidoreductase subunit C [Ignavibacteria bacterium]|nr:NADH-quinone oxidoreductase subunit C [Bacteroidota bacterium]MSQ45543.1 NADH-quinone oxidoreductase subunit C [Ignavibacteria bacterium]